MFSTMRHRRSIRHLEGTIVIRTVKSERQDEMNQHRTARTNRPGTAIRRVAAGSLLVTVTLAGCGSDADDTLGVQEFRDRSNEICAQSTQVIGEALGPILGGSDPTPQQLQDALDTLVSSSRTAVEDIDALAAPSSMRADVDAMLTEFRSANDDAEAQGLSFWEIDDDPWAAGNALAAELGLDACAES